MNKRTPLLTGYPIYEKEGALTLVSIDLFNHLHEISGGIGFACSHAKDPWLYTSKPVIPEVIYFGTPTPFFK